MCDECASGVQHATLILQLIRYRISVSRLASKPSPLGEISTGEAVARASRGARVAKNFIVTVLRWWTGVD
jgi:hypothetical protein